MPFIWRSLRGRGIRSLLLLLGVLVVSGAFGLLTSAAETVQVVVDEDLAKYWRTTYDVLVRPPGSRLSIEEKYDLVQANHLSGIPGGITFEQYEAIRDIPGVEVAAPIAMLSYFDMNISFGFERQASRIKEPGFYRIDVTLTVDDGLQQHEVTLRRYLFLPSESFPLSWEERVDLSARRLGVVSPEVLGETAGLPAPFHYGLPILLAAIDPEQEAALVGLDEAVTERSYFCAGDVPRGDTHFFEAMGAMVHDYHVPILLNSHSYVQAEVQGDVWRLDLPADGDTFQEVLERGEAQYLDTFPVERAGSVEHSNAEIYQWLLDYWGNVILYPWTASMSLRSATFAPLPDAALPAAPEYVEIQAPWAASTPVLEVRPRGLVEEPESGVTRTPEVRFRAVTKRRLEGVQEGDQVQIEGEIVGGFDIEKLPPLAEGLVYVPLETYYPPLVTLRYDESGTPVEPPVKVHPTFNPEGYIQRPPLLLTTLEAAKLFNPVDPISAVRVRVGGIDRYSPEAQARIDAIAGGFLRARGLLDFPYRVEPDADAPESTVRFVRLAEGHPVRNSEVRVTVAPDGRVATASYPLLALEPAGEYPIRSAQDAWDALRSGQLSGEVQYTILREAPGPAAGPFKFWRPQYRPDRRADLYGSPIGFLPAEGDGSPLVEMNSLRLYGDVRALSEQQGSNLHVWGQVRQEVPGVLALDMAGLEVISQPLSEPFHGAIQVKDGLVLLLRGDGETFVLPNPPDDLTGGLAVSIYGRETERTEGGYPVLDWQFLQTPPDAGPDSPHGTITTTEVSVVQVEEPPITPTMPVPQTPLPPPPAPETHATATPAPVPTVAGQPASPRPITHTILAGETLQGIAWQYGVTAEAILRANGLTEPKGMRVGQVLVIPTPSETMDEAPSGNVVPVGPMPTPTAPPGGRTGTSGGGYSPPPVLPTPPLEPGQRVEGLEGQLSATIYESGDGESRTLRQGSGQALQVTLAEMPLIPEPGWEVRLSGVGLADVEPYNRLRVRVWGRYVVEGDQPVIQVERYETAYPDQRVQAWLGTVEIATVEGREVALFQTREGERYVLASSLRHPDLDWYRQAIGGHQVLQEGVVRPETFGGYPVIEELGSRWGGDVDRMTGLEDHQRAAGAPVQVVRPEEPPLPGKAFVEQVELVYYAVPVADIAYAGDPSLRVVQPVWRFVGHTEDGATFEVLVQAVRDEYLK
ncbi:MAG: LysM peptidoglycan-binding domain-containing protein [Chloroflexota bacterium]|nr:LysM peptidoglycan-binding domain-containing protein [Chloroflexota bacterium]